jgi:DNA-binding transcriptional ArsR family regulator
MVEDVLVLDRVFRALASEPRREILRQTATRRCTVGELAERFDMSLAAVSKHVRVLEDANLLAQTREGRLHYCRMNPGALEPAHATLEDLRSFWNGRLDALERILKPDGSKGLGRRRGRR